MNTNFTAKQFATLSKNDRSELMKFQRFLKLQKTKWGRKILITQQYWRDYQALDAKAEAYLRSRETPLPTQAELEAKG